MPLQSLCRFCLSRRGRLLAPWLTVLAAGIVAPLLFGALGSSPAEAAHGNLNVHVHDDFYHPAGAFLVGPSTDHGLAQAACQSASPATACDATIHAGDTITWVSPAPLAINPHTVTECTDGTFSTCGAGVAAGNPIEDSGFRAPPSPGPSGWPYGPVQFNAPGTYYYLCALHSSVMRGRIVVLSNFVPVGGVTEFSAADHASQGGTPAALPQSTDGNAMPAALVAALIAAGATMIAAVSVAAVKIRTSRR